ncbi:MAG: 2-succinyl-6-hydroxy-2,4-cyclohexadiene-1-carboxylate synthase [Myxococcaceae bacterium]
MGLTLAHEAWGQGERPLVLLHGFTGNRSAFDHLRPAWERRLRAIAVDLPGHGSSPLPERSGPAGFTQTLEALEALVDRQGTAPVDLAGYSQGARIALAFALRHPGRVRRLVLESGTPGLRHPDERAERRADDERLAGQLEADGVEAFIARWEALPLFAGLSTLPAPLAEALRARRRSASAAGLAGALRCLGLGCQESLWPLLSTLRAPVLLVTGARDGKFTALAREMAAALPRALHRELDAHHAPHLEAPDAYAREVLTFLEARPGTPPGLD